MRFLFALVLLLSAYAHAEEDLLEPEKAFRYSARLIEPGKIEARFQIANGYYLYRDKIKFSADNGIKLGDRGAAGKGKIKQDENFGEVETYRGDLRVKIPFTPCRWQRQGIQTESHSRDAPTWACVIHRRKLPICQQRCHSRFD
jgi:thiol:disulfide interchange protein DsbD